METQMNYNQAYEKLMELVEQLHEGNVPLDALTEKIKQANEFIAICEQKLRQVEGDVKGVLEG